MKVGMERPADLRWLLKVVVELDDYDIMILNQWYLYKKIKIKKEEKKKSCDFLN